MNNFLLPSDTEEIANRISEKAVDFSGKRILMTGGRGFLGRHFVDVFNFLNKGMIF